MPSPRLRTAVIENTSARIRWSIRLQALQSCWRDLKREALMSKCDVFCLKLSHASLNMWNKIEGFNGTTSRKAAPHSPSSSRPGGRSSRWDPLWWDRQQRHWLKNAAVTGTPQNMVPYCPPPPPPSSRRERVECRRVVMESSLHQGYKLEGALTSVSRISLTEVRLHFVPKLPLCIVHSL